ncbi:alcohol dehydrogenase catalytic domain-containing protein, partial [Streptomyces sp. NPDC003233]
MRRVRYESTGGPLFLEEAPVPEPGPGELLVRCAAIGVTLPVVRKVTEAAEPIALGGEIAGEVVGVGEGVTRFRPGEQVTGLCFGHGYADFALLPEDGNREPRRHVDDQGVRRPPARALR